MVVSPAALIAVVSVLTLLSCFAITTQELAAQRRELSLLNMRVKTLKLRVAQLIEHQQLLLNCRDMLQDKRTALILEQAEIYELAKTHSVPLEARVVKVAKKKPKREEDHHDIKGRVMMWKRAVPV